MRTSVLRGVALALSLALVLPADAAPRRTVMVTYSVLGAVVKDLAGDAVEVQVAVPNGLDPHDWEPSAKDVAKLTRADLVVANGLGLEAGMARALDQARAAGVPVFVAADAIEPRRVAHGEGSSSGRPHRHDGALDPHLWTDPMAMKSVARALSAELGARFALDLSDRLDALEGRIDALDAKIRRAVEAIPPAQRKLVTGHESLGYFARRYGFRFVGSVVPGLSTQSESSAAGLATLKQRILDENVRVLFTEIGTPPRLVEALARETGVRCVALDMHSLPADGTYDTFMHALAGTIARSLR